MGPLRSPARASPLATTPALHHDGRDLAVALLQDPARHSIVLEKVPGQTQIVGQGLLDEPAWRWPD